MKSAIIISTIGITIIALLFYAVAYGFAYDCARLGQNTNHPTKFSFFGAGEASCLISVEGQWIPTDKWIVNSGK